MQQRFFNQVLFLFLSIVPIGPLLVAEPEESSAQSNNTQSQAAPINDDEVMNDINVMSDEQAQLFKKIYSEIKSEFDEVSPEVLIRFATQYKISHEGLSPEELKEHICMLIAWNIFEKNGKEEAGKKSTRAQKSMLLFSAILRQVTTLINDNLQEDYKALPPVGRWWNEWLQPGVAKRTGMRWGSWILLLPLRLVFPILMAEKMFPSKEPKHQESGQDEQLKKLEKVLKGIALHTQGGIDFEGSFFQDEFGITKGLLLEIPLIKLLPAFVLHKITINKYAGKGDTNSQISINRSEKQMGNAIVVSSEMLHSLVSYQACNLIVKVVGQKKFEKLQNATSDIINFDLVSLCADIAKNFAINHPSLRAFVKMSDIDVEGILGVLRTPGYDDKDKRYRALLEFSVTHLFIHAFTGPIATLLRTNTGDSFTRLLGKTGSKIGELLVKTSSHIKKITGYDPITSAGIDSGVKISKTIVQKFLAPFFLAPSMIGGTAATLPSRIVYMAAHHEEFAQGCKSEYTTRQIARYIVKKVLHSIMNTDFKKLNTKSAQFGFVFKMLYYTTVWYLYRADGAGELKDLVGEENLKDFKEMAAHIGQSPFSM